MFICQSDSSKMKWIQWLLCFFFGCVYSCFALSCVVSHLQTPSLTLPSLSRLSRSHLGASQGRALFALSEAWLSVSLSPLPWHVGAEGEERGLLDGLQSSAHLKPVWCARTLFTSPAFLQPLFSLGPLRPCAKIQPSVTTCLSLCNAS